MGRFLYLWILLFLAWIGFTSSFELYELLIGGVVSCIVALMSLKHLSKDVYKLLHPRRVFFFLIYIPFFIKEMVKANIDVAKRVVNPKLPIKPGIVEIKTGLKSDAGKLALANSITLTPGTITIDIVGDSLFVHWIDVADDTVEGATKYIGEPFEKYLKKVFS